MLLDAIGLGIGFSWFSNDIKARVLHTKKGRNLGIKFVANWQTKKNETKFLFEGHG